MLACQVFGKRERSAAAAKATPDNTLVVRSSAGTLPSSLSFRLPALHVAAAYLHPCFQDRCPSNLD